MAKEIIFTCVGEGFLRSQALGENLQDGVITLLATPNPLKRTILKRAVEERLFTDLRLGEPAMITLVPFYRQNVHIYQDIFSSSFKAVQATKGI